MPSKYYIAKRRELVRTSRAGLLRTHVRPGDHVTTGQLLGETTNLYNEVVESLRAPISGPVLGVFMGSIVHTGFLAFEIIASQ